MRRRRRGRLFAQIDAAAGPDNDLDAAPRAAVQRAHACADGWPASAAAAQKGESHVNTLLGKDDVTRASTDPTEEIKATKIADPTTLPIDVKAAIDSGSNERLRAIREFYATQEQQAAANDKRIATTVVFQEPAVVTVATGNTATGHPDGSGAARFMPTSPPGRSVR